MTILLSNKGGGKIKIDEILSSGTWTKPLGLKVCDVILIGGGASGGKGVNGGGGGGGEIAQFKVNVEGLTTVAATIGAGGAAKTVSGDGNDGGDTLFGTLGTGFGGSKGLGHATDGDGGDGGGRYVKETAVASLVELFSGGIGSSDSSDIEGGAGMVMAMYFMSFWGGGGGGGAVLPNSGAGGTSPWGDGGASAGPGGADAGGGGASYGDGGDGSVTGNGGSAVANSGGGGGGVGTGGSNSGAGGSGRIIIFYQ